MPVPKRKEDLDQFKNRVKATRDSADARKELRKLMVETRRELAVLKKSRRVTADALRAVIEM